MKWPLLLMVLLTASCTTAGPSSDAICATLSPTYLTAAEIDALSDRTARKVLADNEFWKARCG